MNLKNLKINYENLSEAQKRDLHLRRIANGEVYGPMTGKASVDKPWLKHYSEDAIMTSIPTCSAYDFVYDNNKDNLDDVALIYFGQNITYSKLFDEIEKVAKSFKSMGVKKGDIVTVAMATTPELVYILYALNRLGAITNAIDPRLKADELKDRVNDTHSKLFVGLDMAVSEIEKVKEQTCLDNIVEVSPVESLPILIRTVASIKGGFKKNSAIKWKKFLKNGESDSLSIDENVEADDPIVILYTGGTTGKPKGVVLTSKNFNTMALTQLISDFNIDRGDSFLNFLPPFSAYSLVNAIHDPLVMGFKTTLIPSFKPEDFPDLLMKHKPNHVLSGPILWDYMMKSVKYKDSSLSFLKSPISGGDSMSVEFEKSLNKYFEDHGCKFKVQQGYGMTEVSAASCYSTDRYYSLGSVGIPYIKNSVAIIDPNTQEELYYGQDGEVCINTPTMMQCYYDNPAETSKVIRTHSDGRQWVHTGDIGRINENGNLFIVGRMKRMIVRSGNKIFPLNIENLILSVPGVEMCSVVAMPNKSEKSVPVAHIVLSDANADKNEVISMIEKVIRSFMPEFNVPFKYIFRTKIPFTDMAKVDFKQLELESLNFVDDNEKVIILDKEANKVLKKDL